MGGECCVCQEPKVSRSTERHFSTFKHLYKFFKHIFYCSPENAHLNVFYSLIFFSIFPNHFLFSLHFSLIHKTYSHRPLPNPKDAETDTQNHTSFYFP